MGTEHLYSNWPAFIKAVDRAVKIFKTKWASPTAVPFFRGHSKTSHELEPGLYRKSKGGLYFSPYDEANFFYEFRSRAGAMLGPDLTSWDILFSMQHHGVPTRLLDWTENFAAALFFALDGARGDIDLWMVDPYELNQKTAGDSEILDVEENFEHSYFDCFVEKTQSFKPGPTIAIYPRRGNQRLAAQGGLFTIHTELNAIVDLNLKRCHRFTLARKALGEARRFLDLVGVNHFSLFPDLTGLAALLNERFKQRSRRKQL